MIFDDFIPQKWFNSIFSEIENYELVQNPHETWFLWNTVTFKKREWLYSAQDAGWNYLWETDGTILGKVIYGWLSFFWDDLWKAYRFEKDNNDKYIMTKIFDNPGNIVSLYSKDKYDKPVKQTAKVVPYLCTLLSSWTADRVLSTNDDGNGNTILAVNEAGTFDTYSVGQYIYFNDNSSIYAKYQIRQIVQYINDKTVYLSEQYYADPSTWGVDEKWDTYETIDNVVVFNNLRDSNGRCLTIETLNAAEISFRNLGGIDVEVFEWRWRFINSFGTSVGGSYATGEFEIVDPDTALGSSTHARGQKMNSLVLFKSYLLVNLENSISVVWQIGNNLNTTPIYNLNTIIWWESIFGPDAMCNRNWGMYYLGKDRIFNGGDINAISTNIIQGNMTNQGMIIKHFLEEIRGNDWVRVYSYGKWLIIQNSNVLWTNMLVYDDMYQWWMPWIYDGLEIVDKFELFYGDLLIGVENKICIKWGTTDLWADINTKCTVTGSKQVINSLFSLKKIKLMLGYYGSSTELKVTVNLGKQVFQWTTLKNAAGTQYLYWMNLAGAGWTMWAIPIWLALLWWVNAVDATIAKMWLMGIPIGKKCTYYKITFENINNSDLNICWITTCMEVWNPFVTPLTNVF